MGSEEEVIILENRLKQITFSDEFFDVDELLSILDRLDEVKPIRDFPDKKRMYEKKRIFENENVSCC